MLTHIQSCRVCGNDTFQPVVDLGYQHFQGCFKKDGHAAPPARKTQHIVLIQIYYILTTGIKVVYLIP